MKFNLKFGDVVMICLSVFLFACAITSSGCAFLKGDSASASQKAADVRNLARAAASIGTSEALLQNGAWRPQFETAALNLQQLVEGKTLTGALLRNVIASLPVRELKSPQAKIAIESATVLYDSLAGGSVNIESNAYLYAAAQGILDGLRDGLR